MLRPDEERAWNGFLSVEPHFAREPLSKWDPGPDPPDVLATTASGRKVGVELTKWVEHNQLTSGKSRESFEKSYLKIIASETESRLEKIGMVWLSPKGRRVRPQDATQFRGEVFTFLNQQNGLGEPEWEHPQGAPTDEFDGFPTLKKYMYSFWIFPRSRFAAHYEGWDWVTFRPNGGAYTTDWMVQAAIDRIFAKIEDYEDRYLHNLHGLRELDLLCHYDDEALLYNTPISRVGFGYADVARQVSSALEKDHGVFDRIFLYHPWETRKAIQVYPAI
jgi:hypothetical protein